MNQLTGLGVEELRAGYLARAFSPVEVFDAVAARVAAVEPVVNAFTTLALERGRREAAAAERAYVAGTPRPLEGIPFAVKDLFDTEGVRTTYGSRMFLDHVPDQDAEAVRRLRAAGAVMVGKTATHEFAWGITSVNAATGTPRNPWHPDRITGGSSGGSAAAVASEVVPFALASDTGGSVRIPAGFCGVTGLKPTFGAISAAGVFPLAPSLDHVGLMTRVPSDLGVLLDLLAGHDRGDPRTLSSAFPRVLRDPARVGVCADLVPLRLLPAVEAAMAGAQAALAGLGLELVEVGFPEAGLVQSTFAGTQPPEAHRVHVSRGLYPARAAEYGDDVRARLEAAAALDPGAHPRAQADRERIRAGFRRLFDEVDVLLTPATSVGPPGPADRLIDHFGTPRTIRALVMPFMLPQDLAGLPAIVLRGGFDSDGIPIGVQLTAAPGADHALVALAARLHDASPEIQGRRPPLP